MGTCLKPFFKNYFTLDIWRWGIQAIICAVLTSLLVVIPALNDLFKGAGYWAVSSAVVVLEGTTGASIKKCLERLGGTFIGGMMGWGLFVLVTWNESLSKSMFARVALWIVVCLFPMPWGYIRVKFPKNPLISVYGVMTGYIVLISSYFRGDAFSVALLRVLAVSTGVLVASIVVHVVFPRRARVEVKKGLADVLLSIADILEPLIEISAGLAPLETLNVIQPVKDRLWEIAMKKYELREKRDRYVKRRTTSVVSGELKGVKEAESAKENTVIDNATTTPTTPTVPRSIPADEVENESRNAYRVGTLVRKLSIGITGLFRPDAKDSQLPNLQTPTITENQSATPKSNDPYISNLDRSTSLLPTLAFQNAPQLKSELPSIPSPLSSSPSGTERTINPSLSIETSEHSQLRSNSHETIPSLRDSTPCFSELQSTFQPLTHPPVIQNCTVHSQSRNVSPDRTLRSKENSLTESGSTHQGSMFKENEQIPPSATCPLTGDGLSKTYQKTEQSGVPLSKDFSAVSSASAFYRDQSLQLEILRAKTLKDVTVELQTSLEIEERERKERWGRAMGQFEKCQKLLSAQTLLLIEAKQEISVHGATVFPSFKYQAAYQHIQGLFHHCAALYFSLDLQIAQVSHAHRVSCAAIYRDLEKPRFRSIAALGVPHMAEDADIQKGVYAGMSAAIENTHIFGHIIVEAAVNIRDALKGLASSVLTGESVEDPLELVDAAARAITVLNDLRKQRSQIISKVFTTAMVSEMKGKWVPPLPTEITIPCLSCEKTGIPHVYTGLGSPTIIGHSNDDVNDSSTSLPWELLMGVEPHVFQEMTVQEHAAYWENFWRARDRLSVTSGTLMLLRDQLYVLCEVIEAIVATEHRKKKKKKPITTPVG